MYEEGAMTDQKCQKWFVKFHGGDFLMDDAARSGRPVEVDSDKIKTLIENNQCYIMWEIADIFTISKSIKLLVKMKNVSYFMEKNHTNFLANLIEYQFNTLSWCQEHVSYNFRSCN